jgi:hypothetical protein
MWSSLSRAEGTHNFVVAHKYTICYSSYRNFIGSCTTVFIQSNNRMVFTYKNNKELKNSMTLCPRDVLERFSLDYASLGQCVPWTMCSLDNVPLGQCVPWTMCPLDNASRGQCVPWKCVPWTICPLDNVSIKQSVPDQCVPTLDTYRRWIIIASVWD